MNTNLHSLSNVSRLRCQTVTFQNHHLHQLTLQTRSSWICGPRVLFTIVRTAFFRCRLRLPFACQRHQQGSQKP